MEATDLLCEWPLISPPVLTIAAVRLKRGWLDDLAELLSARQRVPRVRQRAEMLAVDASVALCTRTVDPSREAVQASRACFLGL